jgi:hypothetical protein
MSTSFAHTLWAVRVSIFLNRKQTMCTFWPLTKCSMAQVCTRNMVFQRWNRWSEGLCLLRLKPLSVGWFLLYHPGWENKEERNRKKTLINMHECCILVHWKNANPPAPENVATASLKGTCKSPETGMEIPSLGALVDPCRYIVYFDDDCYVW